MSKEPFKLMANASGNRGKAMRKMIGAQAIGMTACPCAMETIRDSIKGNVVMSDEFPVISHNQRNISTLMIEVPGNNEVEANDLIDILELVVLIADLRDSEAFGRGGRGHKRPPQPEVRRGRGQGHPCERCWRDIHDLPDEVKVTVRSESEESIHKHNAFAERVTTMKELRE